jgi:hypothetical protein
VKKVVERGGTTPGMRPDPQSGKLGTFSCGILGLTLVPTSRNQELDPSITSRDYFQEIFFPSPQEKIFFHLDAVFFPFLIGEFSVDFGGL